MTSSRWSAPARAARRPAASAGGGQAGVPQVEDDVAEAAPQHRQQGSDEAVRQPGLGGTHRAAQGPAVRAPPAQGLRLPLDGAHPGPLGRGRPAGGPVRAPPPGRRRLADGVGDQEHARHRPVQSEQDGRRARLGGQLHQARRRDGTQGVRQRDRHRGAAGARAGARDGQDRHRGRRRPDLRGRPHRVDFRRGRLRPACPGHRCGGGPPGRGRRLDHRHEAGRSGTSGVAGTVAALALVGRRRGHRRSHDRRHGRGRRSWWRVAPARRAAAGRRAGARRGRRPRRPPPAARRRRATPGVGRQRSPPPRGRADRPARRCGRPPRHRLPTRPAAPARPAPGGRGGAGRARRRRRPPPRPAAAPAAARRPGSAPPSAPPGPGAARPAGDAPCRDPPGRGRPAAEGGPPPRPPEAHGGRRATRGRRRRPPPPPRLHRSSRVAQAFPAPLPPHREPPATAGHSWR